VIAGALARFWGLGRWPLAIDEYYFAQSVQNVLHSGLPEFPCGGYYVRGLLLQYCSAALQLAGLSAELAPRLIAAISSLLALPAVFLIGRRIGGREVGLLAVALLALSVWEVEIGRFGRMYAPFQAVFSWYLVFFTAYAVDGRKRALAPMLILSVIGVLVWEGGLFLILANLLPPFISNPAGRLRVRDWGYLVACSLLFIPAYPVTLADLRGMGKVPMMPDDYQPPPDVASPSRLDAAVMPWTTLSAHPGWMLLALIPATLVLMAAYSVLRSAKPPLTSAGLLLVLGAAAMQQFELAAGLALILVLLGIVDGRWLVGREARPVHIALVGCVVFWIAFGLGTQDWHEPGLSLLHRAMLLGYQFVILPDAVREIALPWARTVPLLALGLFLLVGAACLRACIHFESTPRVERILLGLFVILLFAASGSHPPRHETRYVFFLYPLAVIFALLTIERLVRALLGPTRLAAGVAAAVCLVAFALSEDFRAQHLLNIDTEAVNFRIGMRPWLAGHYHPRSDVRAAAVWLQQHAVPGQDVVIDSFPGVDFYYRNSNFYFVSDTDGRFESWSCDRGTVQRWSNLPMIHSFGILAAKVATGRRVWMVLESSNVPKVVAKFPPTEWTLEWTSKARDITILALHEPPDHG
jgi:hypothetical protein